MYFYCELVVIFLYSITFFQEWDKKQSDYLKNEASSKTEFHNLCKQLGIQGDRIKKELVDRLQELPGIYEKVTGSMGVSTTCLPKI